MSRVLWEAVQSSVNILFTCCWGISTNINRVKGLVSNRGVTNRLREGGRSRECETLTFSSEQARRTTTGSSAPTTPTPQGQIKETDVQKSWKSPFLTRSTGTQKYAQSSFHASNCESNTYSPTKSWQRLRMIISERKNSLCKKYLYLHEDPKELQTTTSFI